MSTRDYDSTDVLSRLKHCYSQRDIYLNFLSSILRQHPTFYIMLTLHSLLLPQLPFTQMSLGGKITLDGENAAELLLLSSMTGVKAKEFTDMSTVTKEEVQAAGTYTLCQNSFLSFQS